MGCNFIFLFSRVSLKALLPPGFITLLQQKFQGAAFLELQIMQVVCSEEHMAEQFYKPAGKSLSLLAKSVLEM